MGRLRAAYGAGPKAAVRVPGAVRWINSGTAPRQEPFSGGGTEMAIRNFLTPTNVQIEPPGSQGLLGIPDAARGVIFAEALFLKHPAGRALHG